ncbi:MAG: T9SS type A sorting domain-containing protein [Bacteroidota bacterium]
MNQRYLPLIFLLLFTFPMIGSAQGLCGTEATAEQIEYLSRTRDARQNYQYTNPRNQIIWVPIQVHIGRPSTGQGGLSPIQIPFLLSELNAFYLTANIQFYECSALNYIDDDVFYNFDYSEETALLNAHQVSNVLNIYFFASLTYNGGNLCGYSYLPPSADVVMMANFCSTNGSTLIHEVGHYLSLYHTHGKTNSGTTDEYVDGSNCSSAGDDVCDTPADPNLFGRVDMNCNYTGNQVDAKGDPFQPMTNNIMSYALSSCRTVFTPGQFARVSYSLANDRNYLTCATQPPCSTPITTYPWQEGFENGLTDWFQYTLDDVDWTLGSGPTPSPNTGPSAAYEGNNYVYMEVTPFNQFPNLTAALLRESCFDFRGLVAPKMGLSYHMYGAASGILLIQISRDGGNTWSPNDIVWQQSGDQGNAWQQAVIDLTAFAGLPRVKFRLGAYTGLGDEGDMAFDDISIYEGSPCTPPSLSVGTVEPSCFGDSDGSASATVSGGQSPYTYAWSTGGTTPSVSGLAAGTYSLTVTDDLGCQVSTNVNLTQPMALSLAFSGQDESNPNAVDGSIDMTIMGGTAPYTISWTHGPTTEDLQNLSGGVYKVVVTDASGCNMIGGYTVATGTSCAQGVTSFPYNEGFENGLGIWNQDNFDDFDWTVNAGATPSNKTGPPSAYEGTYYLYAEASSNENTSASISSECIDLSALTNAELKFRYTMYGRHMGSLGVSVSTDGGQSWNLIWIKSGNQGKKWRQAKINLGNYAGQVIHLRIKASIGSGYRSDIAIDKLKIRQLNNDLIYEPVSAASNNWKVYPNPATEKVTLELSYHIDQASFIRVVDATGRVVIEDKVPAEQGIHQKELDVSHLTPGLYFITVRNEVFQEVQRLLIMR